MMPDWPIRFTVPACSADSRPDLEAVKSEAAKIAEQMRCHVEACSHQLEIALWEWAVFSRETGSLKVAEQAILRLLGLVENCEGQAFYNLSLGQLLEQVSDFEAAIAAYQKGIKQEPSNTEVRYFLHNNLGYCLNRCNRYQEAESWCRLAIAVDSVRHNAYKNLGLSLEGQGKMIEAAQQFVTATRCCASDGRALHHLEQLIDEYPELYEEWLDLAEELARCREAVKIARLIGRRIETAPHSDSQ